MTADGYMQRADDLAETVGFLRSGIKREMDRIASKEKKSVDEKACLHNLKALLEATQ